MAAETPRTVDPRTLGVVTWIPAKIAETGIWVPGNHIRNFEVMRPRFARTVISVCAIASDLPACDSFLEWPREDIVALPEVSSLGDAPRYLFAFRRAAREMAKECDLLLVRSPFPHPWVFHGIQKPTVFQIASDVTKQADESPYLHGVRRVAGRSYARAIQASHRILARRRGVRIVTHGSLLARTYSLEKPAKPATAVVSSCIYRGEMGEPRAAAPHGEARILFVGYFRAVKDIPTLLSAFEKVRAKRPLSLTIVGSSDDPTAEERLIRERIAASPFANDIRCVGPVPFGSELFEYFRTHDLLVLSSTSEGTPRVVVEARAFGCPVISTRVGGVPDSITDGEDGLLVPARSPGAMAEQITRVLDDSELYLRLSKRGWERTRDEFSLEAFGDRLEAALVDAALEFGSPE